MAIRGGGGGGGDPLATTPYRWAVRLTSQTTFLSASNFVWYARVVICLTRTVYRIGFFDSVQKYEHVFGSVASIHMDTSTSRSCV